MTDPTMKPNSTSTPAKSSSFEIIEANLAKRYAKEKRFKALGLISIGFGIAFLLLLFSTIIGNGYTAFQQSEIQLEIFYDADELEITDVNNEDEMLEADFTGLARDALAKLFPEVSGRKQKRARNQLISSGVDIQLRNLLEEDPSLLGKTTSVWVLADDDVDAYMKGHINRKLPEDDRRIKDFQLVWIDALEAAGNLELKFNTVFFTHGDSREPELAGIWGAVKGSFYTLMVTLLLSFPIGVAAAVYLEEFAKQNRWTDLIEVNINNLAAVPSIIFGLLGLAVLLGFFGLPRSTPLVGGMVLTLMTLPTIIISARAALKSVPPSIREAAIGMGASPMQVVTHHVLPLAMPGMLTGTIIGMAQALGETAPLLMIGMAAFIVDAPQGIVDPSTVLPMQIFQWSDSPERGFVERTSAAIIVLLCFLVFMNALAVLLRKKFERRW